VQTGGAIDVPAIVWTVPAGHAVSGVQLAWLGLLEYSPEVHGAHVRSTDADGAFETNVPGMHVVHGVQLAVLTDVENVPAAQDAHTRSLVPLPAEAT
jgi:hypothetical protein